MTSDSNAFWFCFVLYFFKYKLFLKQKLYNQFLVELKFEKKVALQIYLYSPHNLELSVKKKRKEICSVPSVMFSSV